MTGTPSSTSALALRERRGRRSSAAGRRPDASCALLPESSCRRRWRSRRSCGAIRGSSRAQPAGARRAKRPAAALPAQPAPWPRRCRGRRLFRPHIAQRPAAVGADDARGHDRLAHFRRAAMRTFDEAALGLRVEGAAVANQLSNSCPSSQTREYLIIKTSVQPTAAYRACPSARDRRGRRSRRHGFRR